MNSSSKIDYREVLIPKRLKNIGFILLVASGKGGVGKSLVSATTALILARKGFSTGLLDLDFHGPSSSIIYGTDEVPKEEEEGLIPPIKEGVKIMSIDLFVSGQPVPVGGDEKRELIKELLALTHWGSLDYLIVDMPPETGDVLLATLTYLRGRRGALLVTTPTKLSMKVVERLVTILQDVKVPIIGIVENMSRIKLGDEQLNLFGGEEVNSIAMKYCIPYLGSLPMDPDASRAADEGEPSKLLSTRFAAELERVIDRSGFLKGLLR